MLFALALAAFLASSELSYPLTAGPVCSSTALPFPTIFGLDVVSILAEEVHNYTTFSLRPGTSDVTFPNISFCNITVSYIHPGWSDEIHVSVWLPLEAWNERLQALGGGGYNAGFGDLYMAQAVAAHYVAIETDAGHSKSPASAQSPSQWILTSPGNINMYLLEDFATRSLSEMTMIGKSITESYYGSPAKYSYFSGCSGGGRQGLEIAQRYPDHYDGILSVAPAIYIEIFIPAAYWATQVMKSLDYYPSPCEIDAFTQEAIAACDVLDGTVDGVIREPDLCNFNAHDVVGQDFTCKGVKSKLTSTAATIVQAAWTGPKSPSGKVGWFGTSKDAALTKMYLVTQCADGLLSGCTAGSASLLSDWFRYFLAKDPGWNASAMTNEQFFEYLEYSKTAYGHILSSSSPDLTAFGAAGGKMITWHGGADEVIPAKGTIAYYDEVLASDPDAARYYRVFEAPGVGHCIGGRGPIPNDAFYALVNWVEHQIAPDYLKAVPQAADGKSSCLLPYPLKHRHITGAEADHNSWDCELDTDKQKATPSEQSLFSLP